MVSAVVSQDTNYFTIAKVIDIPNRNTKPQTKTTAIFNNNNQPSSISTPKINNFKEVMNILHKAGFTPYFGNMEHLYASSAYRKTASIKLMVN